MCRQSATVCLIKSPGRAKCAVPGIAKRLGVLPDPRGRRGRRHSLSVVLLAVYPGGLADLLGCDPAGAAHLALDVKTARGSRTDAGPAARLLSAGTADGRVVSRLRVPDKTTEVTGFTRLLAPFDLSGVTVTADALHTYREHAKWLVQVKQEHYLFVVKRNQPTLHAALRSLPWTQVTARRYDRECGHGRRETRSVRALTVTSLGLDFPHVVQAAKIVRYRVAVKTGKVTRKTIYAITDLSSAEASPQFIDCLTRSQWGIEAVHQLRDTVFGEDASKIRTGLGPDNMATLRNFAINTLRSVGHRSIASGLRHRRRLALVTVTADAEVAHTGTLLVQSSSLVDALVALFEATWPVSSPVPEPGTAHVRRLMELTGAGSRVQLRWQLAKRGWV